MYRAAMTLDDSAYIGQTHSFANELFIRMQAPERFEKLIGKFRIKACSVVRKVDLSGACG